MCSRVRNNQFAKSIYIIVTITLFIFTFIFAEYKIVQAMKMTHKLKNEQLKLNILKGKNIVFQSGCYTCHSFIKSKRYDGVISLADWGDKHLTLKQTEKAIRNCKADIYCSQILTDKQVKYVAEYLNSLKK